jgi:hypothetical protein
MYTRQKTMRRKAGEKPDCSPMIRKVNHIRNPSNLLLMPPVMPWAEPGSAMSPATIGA